MPVPREHFLTGGAMLNLAPLRYRDVLAADGGPVERFESGEFQLAGQSVCFTNAWLRAGLAPEARHFLYGAATGTGVDRSPMVARFKAVSEAMERWAHAAVLNSSRRRLFGFDVDPSSNGLGAYPGLFSRQARGSARLEAAERFSLLHWWEGRLDARTCATPWPGVTAVVPRSEAPGVTVILFRRGEDGLWAYGHAAGRDFPAACGRALEELERHAAVIRRHARAHAGAVDVADLPAEAHTLERRALYFATPAGHECFQARLRSGPTRPQVRPKLVFDGVIPGPWSRYADVWRVLYEPPSLRFIGRELDYFFL